MKKVTRRKFIISSAKGAAGLGIIGGCNNITVHPDIRPPSAPKGLKGFIEYESDLPKCAHISWDKHDLTDNTGAPTEVEIKGYNIFRDEKKIYTSPPTQLYYVDNSKFIEGSTYQYQVTAIDKKDNESDPSEKCKIKAKKPGIVYKITNQNASSNNVLDAKVIKTMINAGLLALTGESTIAKAYDYLFPNINSTTKIGIKINTLAGFLTGGLCTHPEVVDAVVDGLKQTSIAVNNIIVFDDRKESIMNGGNFILRNNPDDYRILSTYDERDGFGNINWSTTNTSLSGVNQRFCRIVEDVDYIINMPVLKNHSSAGITFALKNFFGIIDNPEDFHPPNQNPNTYCDPYIAQVYNEVADKVKLIVGDAIFGAHVGGPSTTPRFKLNTILLGVDPVAMDMYALDLINAEREKDERYIIATSPDTNFPNRADARHIVTADSSDYDLGSQNKEVIEVSI
jgi:uncharacterized protein (DUF362 family)